ncbi:site-specific recombinase XerD [Geothermobacter ehrlichii]|uniref:Site-specific recombinase XerD n=1 Tax=Geothermobacter ehrlichii TaxID=213224 RepID=A0A5D3WJU1_9BACT|nr:tyrosine-type recombinase/integrase [Geothermobacter ehrlichii]TYO96317.1 site-specific recombinase XerD [Geothermobacter ehrlichii]
MNSESYTQILGYVRLATHLPRSDDVCLANLLEILGVETSLKRILPVLKTFVQIRKDLELCIPKNLLWAPARARLKDAFSLAEHLLQKRSQIQTDLPSLDLRPTEVRNNVFQKQISEGPFLATLGYLPTNPEHLGHWHLLLAQIILVRLLTVQLNREGEAREQLGRALRTVRGLADDPLLAQMPMGPCVPERFLDDLRRIENEKLTPLTTYLETALELCRPHPFSLPDLNREQTSSGADDTTFEEESEKATLVVEDLRPTEEESEPPEANSLVFAFQRTLPDGKRVQQDSIRATTQRQARENQMLPGSWDNLNQHELEVLVKGIFSETRHDCIEARIQLGIMLFAGLDPKRIRCLLVVDHPDNAEGPDTYISQTRCLRLRSEEPQLKTRPSTEATQQTWQRQFHVDLPLPPSLAKLIERYVALRSSTTPTQLFVGNAPSSCQSLLAKLRKKASRLTFHRIQDHLLYRLANLPNSDIAVASLLLGRKIYLARTRVHYAAFDPEFLQQLYIRACNDLLREAGQQDRIPERYPLAPPRIVGTPRRPRLAEVQHLADKLKEQIDQTPLPRTQQEWVACHNSYTLYTLLFLAYCTGLRPNHTPYIPPQRIDPANGLTVIWDKSGIDQYHCRLAWLSPECVHQINHYHTYINRYFQTEKGTDNPAELSIFFLSPEMKPVAVTRQELVRRLAENGFFLPPNVQRHLLKSELQEDGCHWEVIEALLGHWHLGEEPWAQTSALHPDDFRQELSRYIVRLLERLGFKAIQWPPERRGRREIIRLPGLPASKRPGRTSQMQKASARKVRQILDDPPGELWQQLFGVAWPNGLSTKPEQIHVLDKLRCYLPDIYKGNARPQVNLDQLRQFIEKLEPHPVDPRVYHRRISFLIRGLERGRDVQNWDIPIPPKPVINRKPRNLAKLSLVDHVLQARLLEKALVKELENPPPDDPLIALGQILVSAVLFGGINHQTWAEALVKSLPDKVYLYQKTLWVDLWREDIDDIPPQERWRLQRNPTLYRRWLPDPVTRNLILQFYSRTQRPMERQSLSLKSIYAAYRKHLKAQGHALPTLRDLLRLGQARTTLTNEPFLSAYSQNKILSASLPDPAWVRLLTNKAVGHQRPSIRRRGAIITDNHTDWLKLQKQLIRELRHRIDTSSRKTGDTSTEQTPSSPEQTKNAIATFLADHQEQLSEATALLGRWAMQLLSARIYPQENRKVQPEAKSTVISYLEAFDDEFLLHAVGHDISEMDEDDFKDLISKTANEIIRTRTNQNNDKIINDRTVWVIERLNQFLSYLHLFEECPDLFVDLKKSGIRVYKKDNKVRANLLSVGEYRDLRSAMGWKRRQDLSRRQRMTLVALVLLYRTGMRINELGGILVEECVGREQLEILVQRNRLRGIKSRQARRRLPLWLLLPKEELDFVRTWLTYRRKEPGTTDDAPLFADAPFDMKPTPLNALVGPIRDKMVEVTGDETLTLHGLRHTFANNLLTSLLCEPTESKSSILADDDLSAADRIRLREHLLGDGATSKKALFCLAMLLGHASTDTTLTSYIHLCDRLVVHNSQRKDSAPPLTTKAIARLTGRGRRMGQNLLKKQTHPLDKVLPPLDDSIRQALAHPLLQEARSRKTPAFKPDEKTLSELLYERIVEHKDQLPTQLKWPESKPEMEVLQVLFEQVAKSDDRNKPPTAAKALLDGFRVRHNHIEISHIHIAHQALAFLECLGIPTAEITVHCPRFTRIKSPRSLERKWRAATGRFLHAAPPQCRENLPNGKIRIPIRYLLHDGKLVETDRKLVNLVGVVIFLVSRNAY